MGFLRFSLSQCQICQPLPFAAAAEEGMPILSDKSCSNTFEGAKHEVNSFPPSIWVLEPPEVDVCNKTGD